MYNNEYNSAGNESKPKPKPLKPLVKSGNAAGEYHFESKKPVSKKNMISDSPKKKGFSLKDFLIKFIAIVSSVVIIFALVLNMPIVADTEGGVNISLINLFKNQKPAAKEGELDKDNVIQNLNIDNDAVPDDFDDGLDLPQLVEGQYSVLFLGFEPDEYNTDIMWIFQFDIGHGGLNILQIPRDTCLPDYTSSVTKKFNSIYTMGDPEVQPPIQRVVNAVQENFGIPIDAYVTTTCDDIVEIIDIIGGVPIHIDNEIVFEPDKVIPEGDVVLDGNQSVWFIRFRREWILGDIGRVQNQRRFMAAAMGKLSNIIENEGRLKLYSYIKEIYDNDLLYTDLSIGDMSKIADFASTISMEKAQVNMIPGEDAKFWAADGNVYSVYSVHKQETIDLLNEYYRPYQRKMTEADTSIVELITEHQHETYDDTGASLEEIQDSKEPVRDPTVQPYQKIN